jgi:low affinity Fe/Cu permease
MSAGNLPLSPEMKSFMRKSITIAIAVAITSLFALVFWQVEVRATDTVLEKPDYAITANSYLPIQRLRPAY